MCGWDVIEALGVNFNFTPSLNWQKPNLFDSYNKSKGVSRFENGACDVILPFELRVFLRKKKKKRRREKNSVPLNDARNSQNNCLLHPVMYSVKGAEMKLFVFYWKESKAALRSWNLVLRRMEQRLCVVRHVIKQTGCTTATETSNRSTSANVNDDSTDYHNYSLVPSPVSATVFLLRRDPKCGATLRSTEMVHV